MLLMFRRNGTLGGVRRGKRAPSHRTKIAAPFRRFTSLYRQLAMVASGVFPVHTSSPHSRARLQISPVLIRRCSRRRTSAAADLKTPPEGSARTPAANWAWPRWPDRWRVPPCEEAGSGLGAEGCERSDLTGESNAHGARGAGWGSDSRLPCLFQEAGNLPPQAWHLTPN